MPRQQANVEYNQFQSGLITEGNLLNLPVDSFREGENFVLTQSNSWERRKGLDLEESGSLVNSFANLDETTTVNSVHVWHTHYSALPEIIVVQTGEKLHFFDSHIEPLSSGKILIDSQEYITTNGTTEDIISATSVEGIFVFATKGADPMAIQLTDVQSDVNTGRFNIIVEQEVLHLQTRDLWGRRKPSRERTADFDNDKQYDLTNQGWDWTKIQAVYQELKVYPSDYDVWWAYKVASSDDPNIIGHFQASKMKNDAATGVGQDKANSPAPRGSTIVELQNVASGRPTTVQSYAGRIFYAGFEPTPRLLDDVRPDFSNYVFFTQVVKSNPDILKCYQFADPASETDSDVVDTDGGFVKINSARNILAMEEVSSGLFIIAENGVWQLSGTADGLFSATGYTVNKVSDFGCISSNSVITYGDNVFYWADEGIIALTPDPSTGRHSAQNLTEMKIQTLYNDIPSSNKERAVGVVERSDKYIRWMYSTGANPNHFDHELILSLNLSAFFLNTFKSDATVSDRVIGYIPERNTVDNVVSTDYFVVVGLDKVYVEDSPVTIGLSRRLGDESYKDTKYLIAHPNDGSISFNQFNNDNFLDFNKVDAEAYILSAPQKLDDTQRRKQITSLATHMLRTDTIFLTGEQETTLNPSSMKLRIRWDYADHLDSGKWTKERQCYRYRRPLNLKQGVNVYPFEVITARERIRGSGTAFQFEFRTEPSFDCKLLGWATTVTGGTQV